MIDYALKEPKNPNNFQLDIETISLNSEKILEKQEILNFYKSAYKFPFVASEILSSEINIILDKILPQSEFPNLEESKSYFLNLSTDSYSIKKDENVQDEIGINLTIENEIKKEQNFPNFQITQNLLFNPPEIEFGNEKDKEKEKMSLFYTSEKNFEKEKFMTDKISWSDKYLNDYKNSLSTDKESNLSFKDISFNTSIDRKLTYFNFDPNSFEILDYILSFSTLDLNSVQSSYFKKIICSLLRSSSKNLFVLRNICYRKPESLFNLLNNIHNREICEIIIKLLLTIDFVNLEENSLNWENMKLTIFNKLITNLNSPIYYNINYVYNYDYLFACSNVSEIFIEYIENTKNFEFLISESFLNMYTQFFGNLKNKIAIKEFTKVSNSLLKQFKNEYEKAQKMITSISMMKSKILEKTNILSLDMDNLFVNKIISSSLDNLLDCFSKNSSTDTNLISTLISILEFILNLLTLTRSQYLYEKLTIHNFFENCFVYFFQFPNNDIFHNLILSIFNLFVEDFNELFLDGLIIKSGFIHKIYENWNDNLQSNFFYYNHFSNGKKFLKSSEVFLIKIIHNIYSNLNNHNLSIFNQNFKKVFQSENEFLDFYEKEIKFHVDRMNTTLGNFKINQINIFSMIENNEEIFSKKLDLELQEINKGDDGLDGEFEEGDGEFLTSIVQTNIPQQIDENNFYENTYGNMDVDNVDTK